MGLSFLSPIATLFGGGGGGGGNSAPPVQTPAAVTTPEEMKTPAEIEQEKEAKRKANLVALNAGGSQYTTVGGGNADVTRKILLGL